MADKNCDNVTEALVGPNLVSVISIVPTDKQTMKSPETTGSKEKPKLKHSTPVKKSSADANLRLWTSNGQNVSVVLKHSCYLWKS